MSEAKQEIETRTLNKVFWRIIPFTFVLYVISYIDRANIGYAALHMNAELGLSAEAFGFAAGVFFIGYFLFEVPSNLALLRFGARIWIARICISWGAIAVLCAFAQSATQLYLLRFLLGVAEAGFFPGIIIYLTHWFRAREQATTIAYFTAAIPVSYLISAPVSTWIMDNVSGMGLSGWRWMLILEGLPAILGGIATYFLLTDRPEQARWLSPDEKAWLAGELAKDHAARPHIRHLGTLQAIATPKVLYLAAIYFIYQTGSLGVGYWMPQLIQSMKSSLSATQIGWIAMAPYGVATIAMVLWSRRSDRTGERRWHTAWPLLLAAVALAASAVVDQPVFAIASIAAALSGLYAFKAPFWALPSLFLSRSTAAVSIAAINSIGNLGGFVGPYALGVVREQTGSAVGGLIFLSGLVLVAFVMTALAPLDTGEPGVSTDALSAPASAR